jgi:predicted GNAT family N-acyltransferase
VKITIEFTEHKAVTDESLNQIVNLKMQYWEFSQESQKEWIKKNINENDYHLFIRNEFNELIAYLNIVHMNVACADIKRIFFGVGNVCVDRGYSGGGYGKLLMCLVNTFIKHRNIHGILLCNSTLNSFYNISGWTLFKGSVSVGNELFNDSVFTTEALQYDHINIEKNF